MNDEQKTSQESHFWILFKNVVVFQFRLAMDGVRDLLLSPLSIALAIYGLVFKPDNPGKFFNRLMVFGRKSDVWINLFEMREKYESDEEEPRSSDAYIKKLEELLSKEYRRGGFVKNLKDGTDGLMGRLRERK